MDNTPPDISDEATGLPPLMVPADVDSLLGVAFGFSKGMVRNRSGQMIETNWLHVRGLANSPDGGGVVEWNQVHIAVPAEMAMEIAAALVKGTTEQLG